eukprot:5744444-Lingulodinium_polyedra.AAC.1
MRSDRIVEPGWIGVGLRRKILEIQQIPNEILSIPCGSFFKAIASKDTSPPPGVELVQLDPLGGV